MSDVVELGHFAQFERGVDSGVPEAAARIGLDAVADLLEIEA
jgi:hypothetical protein